MVSIIIPVYDSEKYLVQCLSSVINQTYRKLEIIIVIGKCNDNSEQIARMVSQNDSRVRICKQDGTGAGEARNQGVKLAGGDYLCFVDSDDWIEADYVENMLDAMTANDFDVVECDDYWGNEGKERIEGNSIYAGINARLVRVLGSPACWKQMYRRSFWDREGLCFTNTVAEDLYLYSDLYRASKGSCFLRRPLYHYRIREGGFTDTAQKSIEKYRELFDVFLLLINKYKQKGIWDQFHCELYRQLEPHATNRYRIIRRLIGDSEALELKKEAALFFQSSFHKSINAFNRKVIVFGSYNLSRIGNYFTASDAREVGYGFSSIISALSPRDIMSIKNNNPYRQRMLEKEICRQFTREIMESHPDLVLIDFLEERHGILRRGNSYYTYSDAFAESEYCEEDTVSILRESEECDALWRTSCDLLIELFNDLDEKCDIVLVENYLSEYVGDIYHKDLFDDNRIRSVNELLGRYYEYLKNNCKRIKVIEQHSIPEDVKYTERGFEFGTVSEHYNNYYFGVVADMIMDLIGTGA